MKPYTLKTCCTLIVIASCFIFSSSYGQQLKIVGKPFSAAYDFADMIAQTMKVNAPDSAHTNSNTWRMEVVLSSPDGDDSKRVTVQFYKDRMYKTDNIESVNISGNISAIVELYATLYDKSVKKVKPEDVYTGVDQEGEIRKVRTDYHSSYRGVDEILGLIQIIKSNRTK